MLLLQRPGLDHIFVNGTFANYIWQHFSGFAGAIHNHVPLSNLLVYWWQLKTNNAVHKLFNQLLPIFIYWNLWKNRCSAKYGGKRSSITRVKYLVFMDITHMLISSYPYLSWPKTWTELAAMVERCPHEMRITHSAGNLLTLPP